MYSVVDEYLGLVPSPEKIQIGRLNLIAGASRLISGAEIVLSEGFKYFYSQRNEAISYGNLRRSPHTVFRDLAEQLLSCPANVFETLPTDDKLNILQTLEAMAVGHNELKRKTKPINITTPEYTSIHMQYTDSQWEGIGSINFHLSHPSSEVNPLPAFVLRGNTANTLGTTFDIRTVQPWLSEDMASIAGIKAGYFGIRSKYSPEEIEQLEFILCERNRILDIFMRNNAEGRSLRGEYIEMDPEDIFLNLGLTYLQMHGVSTIRGIKHELHPAQLRPHKKHGRFDLNYDQLFARNLKGTGNDPVHRWEMNGTPNQVYIPDLMALTPAIKNLLMKMCSNIDS